MKVLAKRITLFVTLIFMVAVTANAQELKLGAVAPLTDLKMDDVSNRSISLAEAAKDNGLLVIFSCNTCPWVARWEDRYLDLASITTQNNVGMIALNPNERIRDRGESMDDMKKRAEKKGYTFFYALDKDHKVADAFGATRTPHIFLFDKDMKLVYRGAIDDNANDATKVKEYFLKDAIEAMVAGTAVVKPSTKSLGCTIKRTE